MEVTLPLSLDIDDGYEWLASDSSVPIFSSFSTWEALRSKMEVKDWHDVVLFKGALPKHVFTMWTANYDKLPTRARLAGWGMQISPLCAFCSNAMETRDHLFLSCAYSLDVWSEVFARCNPPTSPFTSWAELLSWIRQPRSKSLSLLRKLVAQTMVFQLWKQRNNMIHNHISVSAAAVFIFVDRELRNIISSRREKKSFATLMAKWLR
ncbi:uncharacterized protein LOC108832226 [Raphanus sativus]|uniref:Uncharacterized protein LOC108832226 n=1 Tax=Raphanus sativus TaxID=3726 RepID=A0A6J0LLV8_RAPSA|nr:uncharacterized protein LOC108832226 [Raphanus sativus]